MERTLRDQEVRRQVSDGYFFWYQNDYTQLSEYAARVHESVGFEAATICTWLLH
jgi:hypothetical protein